MSEQLRFVYGEPALRIREKNKNYIVIGDLHIGAEKRFFKRGVKVYDASAVMAQRIKKIAKENNATALAILGDVKESVLHPDSAERREIERFFDELSDYEVLLVRGNHDPFLEDIIDLKISDELFVGDFALIHGHVWPSEEAMEKRWILAGHNHMAVRIKDKGKGIYFEKAWLVSKLSYANARKRYPKINRNAEMVVFPAFNDLIMGMAVNENIDENLSPIFRNKVFDYKNGTLFGLRGEVIGTPKSLSKKGAPPISR